MGDLLMNTFQKGNKDIIKAGWHVGMAATSVLEPMVMLYRYTGDKRYLSFCQYIVQSWNKPNGPKILTSLLEKGNVYKPLIGKAYEMLSNLVGLLDFIIQRGPQVLALDDMLDTRSSLPPDWIGDQFYQLKGRVNGEEKIYRMVPFADAGQTMGHYQVAVDKMEEMRPL